MDAVKPFTTAFATSLRGRHGGSVVPPILAVLNCIVLRCVMAQPSLAFHTDSYLRIPQQILARTLTPFGDRVLVKRIEAQVTTAGGLYLPTTNVKDPNEGTVVAVGPGERDVTGALHAVNVTVGDKVLLPEYGGSKIKIGDEELFLFRESDILGKFE
jgi:chaperonin GroES